jgi:hypothetical protein
MKRILIFTLIFFSSQLSAQKNITTVGLQFKPIFQSSFFSTATQTVIDSTIKFDITLASGFSGGMVIRHGFSDLISLEGGINYVKRKYELTITDNNFKINSEFRIIGYEIPLSLLVYIQLGEKIYINASLGHSLDMYASSVAVVATNYREIASRRHLFQSSLCANLGWEFRTEKSGYFYIGASYHRPFAYIYTSHTEYLEPGTYPQKVIAFASTQLLGNYLTLDLRYFFHEDAKKKTK